MKYFFPGLFFALLHLQSFSQVEYVNPFIGTGGHGHTHPAATAPFGMVQLGPDTRKTGWDGCSGYHCTDTRLHGFSHTHLSGTGVSDYSDILFKPIVDFNQANPDSLISFFKTHEKAEPGYYTVELSNGIKCELTATQRVGAHRYTFPKGQRAMLLVDLDYRDETLSAELNVDGPIMLNGHRFSRSWAQNQKLFFSALFSAPFKAIETEYPHAWLLDFGTDQNVIEVFVGLSSTGVNGASQNLKSEISSFNEMRASTRKAWSQELNKIQVTSNDSSALKIFNSALYHAFSVPNLWSDFNGDYRGMDDEIHSDEFHNHYTVFSLWDTYRTAHPLYTIVQPDRTDDFLHTMLDQFDQSGRLPIWELAANETNCMIGYHSVSVLVDAILKGYSVDESRVLKAIQATAEMPVFGLDDYIKYGFLSIQDESESVSKTLEYAYDDGCIAQLAKFYGEDKMFNEYRKRATAYRSVTNRETGLAQPRDNGHFLKNTNPREVNSHFTEANAWQYSFAPVHDLKGWLEFLGKGDKEKGRIRLRKNLDALFSESSQTTGRNQADITGLIGQYAHGNEPSHHIAYLYNLTDTPWKTQEIVSQVISDYYTDQPDGYIGNEDCGQMSSWYVMSSLGIYPLAPGWPVYMLTTPQWNESIIQLPDGKHLKIQASGKGKYIQSFRVNGEEYLKNWITHADLLKGGNWEFTLSETPTNWGNTDYFETSMGADIASAPIIQVTRRFENETKAEFTFPTGKAMLFNQSGDSLDVNENILKINESGELLARVDRPAGKGHTSKAFFTKKPNNWSADIATGKPSSQYAAGGPSALVDGIYGDLNWQKGEWIGVQGQDLEIVLTNDSQQRINGLRVNVLKDLRAWISLPQKVQVLGKIGDEFLVLGEKDLGQLPLRRDDSAIYSIDFNFQNPIKTKEIKLILKNPGVLPDWHLGKGGETYIFIDEIQILE